MKNIFFVLSLATVVALSSEFQWGKGTMKLKGGFVGLSESISSDINSYSLLENHKNLLGTNFFYSYTFTYLSSKRLEQLEQSYNNTVSQLNSAIQNNTKTKEIKIPELEYKLKGIDAGMALGYDLIHESETDYLGIALYGGLSFPYIDSKKSNDSSSTASNIVKGAFQASKTEINTYKVGIGLYAQKSLNQFLSLYGNSIYAYQKGSLINSLADSSSDITGKYLELSAGIKLQALKGADLNLGIFSLNPRLYATAGWRYRKWRVDDVAINQSGLSTIKAEKGTMNFSSNTFTLGLGYSF